MAKKEDKNLNITIKNHDDSKDEVVVSFAAIFAHLKKYLALWVVFAIIGGMLAGVYSAIKTMVAKPRLVALVSFTYKGIEKGLDPAGHNFDANDSLKTPEVIKNALVDLDMDLNYVESIRRGISVDGIIPEDAIDRITVYKSVYETANSGNLQAAQAMLDVAYYPTEYKVFFDYGETGLSRSDSALVFNRILEDYRDYFYKQFGYNQSLGTAVPAVDYTNYDYAEQIDIFGDTLTTIEKYLKGLANDDTNLFRSNETGFTFNDLYRAAQTIDTIDLDRISSLITVNNITKDKNASINYCNYRIDNLERSSTALKERLNTIEDSIEKYEKDTILIFGNGTDGNDTSYSQASEEYDKLINQRVSTSTELAETKQRIEFYKARKQALSSNKTASQSMKDSVEKQLADLGEKVKELVNTTEITAKEYYQNVEFKNAYNILVPPEASAISSISSIIHNAIVPVILVEGLIFLIYLTVSFFKAIINSNKKLKPVSVADDDDDDDDEEESDIEELIDEIEEAAESKKSAPKKKKR